MRVEIKLRPTEPGGGALGKSSLQTFPSPLGGVVYSTLNPQPSTLNPQPSTLPSLRPRTELKSGSTAGVSITPAGAGICGGGRGQLRAWDRYDDGCLRHARSVSPVGAERCSQSCDSQAARAAVSFRPGARREHPIVVLVTRASRTDARRR